MDTNTSTSPGTLPAIPNTPTGTMPSAASLVLTEPQRQQLDGIVNKMVQNKEADHTIQFVVNDFKSKYGTPATPDNTPAYTPPSKYENIEHVLTDLGTGAAKGALKTVTGLGKIGNNILSFFNDAAKGAGYKGDLFPGSNAYDISTTEGKAVAQAAEPANKTESFGKSAEQIGEWFIPAGDVNKIENILSTGAKTATIDSLTKAGIDPKIAQIISNAANLGTKMAVRAGEGGAIIGAQTGGDIKKIGTGAAISAALPLAGTIAKPILSKATDAIGGAFKRLAGVLSGRGTAVIDEIIKDPKSALQGLTGESLDTLTKDSNKLKTAVVDMQILAGKEHERVINNLQQIFENEGKSFDKGTELNKISDLLDSEYGVTKDPETGEFDFNQSRFLDKDATIINRAYNTVRNYNGPLNPRSLDMLASKIGKLKSAVGGNDADFAVQNVVNSLRDSIAKMGESVGYKEGADMARNYAIAMDKIENFKNLFKATPEDLRPRPLGEKFNGPENTPIPLTEVEKTKIANDLQSLFSGNKDIDKNEIKKLFGGQEILSREAGRTLRTAPEKASSKLEDLLKGIIGTIISPKRIGEIAAYTGIAKEKVPQLVNMLKGLDPGIRGSIIEYLSKNQ